MKSSMSKAMFALVITVAMATRVHALNKHNHAIGRVKPHDVHGYDDGKNPLMSSDRRLDFLRGNEAMSTCGTRPPTPEEEAIARLVVDRWRWMSNNGDVNDKALITIPSYIHIINPNQNEAYGKEADQMSVLNAAFSSHGFSFELINIKTWIYDDWWGIEPGDFFSGSMKAATRVGGCNALNIWFSQLNGRSLGWALYPRWCVDGDQSQDGVVLSHSTIINGTSQRNEGDALVHEVGHWLNLYHTFEGGCGTDGDGVDDTPEVAEANYECLEIDSCPEDGQGNDLVQNYMDYAPGACMDSFTPGQVERMKAAWMEYRAVKAPTKSPFPTYTPSPTALCQDTPDWVDKDGTRCWVYEELDDPGCPKYGGGFEGDMGVANDNCCHCCKLPNNDPVCEGLITKSPSPTTAPPPTSLCQDTPDWVDVNGAGCGLYEKHDLGGCPLYGDSFEGDMGVANDNCCYCCKLPNNDPVCEGFTQNPTLYPTTSLPSTTPSSPPPTTTPLPTSLCQDTPDWVNIFGGGCVFYEDNEDIGCNEYGDMYEGDMGVANDNCCHCCKLLNNDPACGVISMNPTLYLTKSPSPTTKKSPSPTTKETTSPTTKKSKSKSGKSKSKSGKSKRGKSKSKSAKSKIGKVEKDNLFS